MKKIESLCLLLFFSSSIFAQQNLSLLNTFYKDRYFLHSHENIGNGVFPVVESVFDISHAIRDSSKQYYDFTEVLFKKHLLTFKGKDYHLTISPILDISIGRDLSDTVKRNLFQNTRGVYIEGDIMKNFSFSSFFYENQARFSQYETEYYKSLGELYPNQSNGTYVTQNAVIPGAARTKYFKNDGFDYAYAQGNIVYSPHKNVHLIAGNTPNFFGDGYRSLLLSDNAVGSPFLRIDWQIIPQLKFVYLRQRLFNLMRRPVSTTVESYYESKGNAINYLTYSPTKKISISFFESTIWSRGDSIHSKFSNPLIYSPIPLIASLAPKNNEVLSVTGLNFSSNIAQKHWIYGQIALTNFDFSKTAFQLGYRVYQLFNLKDFMIQAEWNYVSNSMYVADENKRLNYNHYNLPLAHPKGNGFNEFLLRVNYEWKRVYVDLDISYYMLNNYQSGSLLPYHQSTTSITTGFVSQNLEVGYRFNKMMNFQAFMSAYYRGNDQTFLRNSTIVSIGIRTGINNHYRNF